MCQNDIFYKRADENALRASPTGNAILSYYTIPKSYFTNYIIQFFNISNILIFIL